ncbi:phosphate-starvation-inducible PsiE family protein [Oscillatoria sp. FACHB-1406]|uniref:phosphate-starvation-inducible PsiE family protein n=1 Tax=Oscillatoria sp. FACHB-1406 TaxID=2692846 RepID=UPI001689C0FE|nr:phosphate-starvation-inducible PsiE family protein [Oscillatoria sp. FACHB-1406]MBD2579487.1 phosphate-starvation-inducible PsiE family protein [Oscillatoria sp. FACHB-1406]
MFSLRRLFRKLSRAGKDERFLELLEGVEVLIAKFLSLVMIVITLLAVYDLCLFLAQTLFYELLYEPQGITKNSLFEAFGLLLNVLIALEILANIAVYLKEHAVQYELVVITSLIAVARKIIIFDLEKKQAIDLIALSVAVLALSTSYFLIRYTNQNSKGHE